MANFNNISSHDGVDELKTLESEINESDLIHVLKIYRSLLVPLRYEN